MASNLFLIPGGKFSRPFAVLEMRLRSSSVNLCRGGGVRGRVCVRVRVRARVSIPSSISAGMGKSGASSIEVFKSEGSIESIDFSGEGGKNESAALTAASTAADDDSISALAGDMCQ